MQMIYKASRYALPVLFLAYAGYANVELFTSGKAKLKSTENFMTGGVTAQLDQLYKTDLPHREAAVGLMGAARYALTGDGRDGVLTGADGWLFTSEEAKSMTESMEAEVARIAAVRDQLAAQGTDLIIVPVPAKADIHADEADRPELTAEMILRYKTFRDALGAAGIASVETRQPMLDVKAETRAFFATDTHWTVAGAEAVAKAAASAVRDTGLVEGGEIYTVRMEPEATFTGDLVSFVTSDTLAPRLGLAPESVVPFVSEAEAGADLSADDLFGGPSAGGIVLVGTSYSANTRWSFAEALKMAIGADVVNVAKEGQGPARPMLSYLKSAEFTDAPPALVIWEFPVRYLADPTIWDEAPNGAEGESAT